MARNNRQRSMSCSRRRGDGKGAGRLWAGAPVFNSYLPADGTKFQVEYG